MDRIHPTRRDTRVEGRHPVEGVLLRRHRLQAHPGRSTSLGPLLLRPFPAPLRTQAEVPGESHRRHAMRCARGGSEGRWARRTPTALGTPSALSTAARCWGASRGHRSFPPHGNRSRRRRPRTGALHSRRRSPGRRVGARTRMPRGQRIPRATTRTPGGSRRGTAGHPTSRARMDRGRGCLDMSSPFRGTRPSFPGTRALPHRPHRRPDRAQTAVRGVLCPGASSTDLVLRLRVYPLLQVRTRPREARRVQERSGERTRRKKPRNPRVRRSTPGRVRVRGEGRRRRGGFHPHHPQQVQHQVQHQVQLRRRRRWCSCCCFHGPRCRSPWTRDSRESAQGRWRRVPTRGSVDSRRAHASSRTRPGRSALRARRVPRRRAGPSGMR